MIMNVYIYIFIHIFIGITMKTDYPVLSLQFLLVAAAAKINITK